MPATTASLQPRGAGAAESAWWVSSDVEAQPAPAADGLDLGPHDLPQRRRGRVGLGAQVEAEVRRDPGSR